MSPTQKRVLRYALPACALVITGLIYWFFSRDSDLQSLRKPLAAIMQTDPAYIHLNLPPASGRYPGTILLHRPDRGPAILRPVLSSLDSTSVLSELLLTSKMTGTSVFESGFDPYSIGAGGQGDLEVMVELKQIRVLEYPGGIFALKNILATDEDVLQQRERSIPSEVIIRAVEAIPTFTIGKSSGVSARVWDEKVKEFQISMKASFDQSGKLVMSTSEPVIVAYETMLISYLAGELGEGKPNVVLSKVAGGDQAGMSSFLDDGRGAKKTKVGFAVLGTSEYQNRHLGNLPFVKSSLQLTRQSLLSLGAEEIAPSLAYKNKWSRDELLEAFRTIRDEARSKELEGVIVYYIGHSAIAGTGHSHLYTSNYSGEVSRVAGAKFDSIFMDSEYSVSGEDIEGIQAMGMSPAELIPGTVSVSEVYDSLRKSVVLFALVLDGCSVNSTAGEFDNVFSFSFFDDEQPIDKQIAYVKVYNKYARAQYQHGADVVIYAEPPGLTATSVKHPYWQGFGPDVGPLAAKIFNKGLYFGTRGLENQDWGNFLESLADFNSDHNWEGKKGSITWSNFEYWGDLKFIPEEEEE